MRPFGCRVTILNTLDHLGKFDSKANEGFLVRYSVNSKAFRVFNSKTRKVKENLHVNFLENKPNVVGSGPEWLFYVDSLTRSMNYEPVTIGNQSNGDASIQTDIHAEQASQEKAAVHEYILLPFIPSNPPLSLTIQSSDLNASDIPGDKDHPKEHIIRDPNLNTQTRRMINFSKEAAMVSFINRHRRTACLLVSCPKWNPRRNKLDERGIVIKNKARLVAQGHTQEEGIDYDEVFAPVARIEAIRLFLAYASFKDFIVYQMDMKSSFLYGKIEEEMSLMGELTFFLGLQSKQKQDGIFISQDKYVAESLKKYGFSEVKTTVVANSTTEAEYVATLSCCGQVKKVNDDVRIQALVDGKRVNIKESSIRHTPRLDDAEGTSCLTNAEIFEGLARMGYEKPSDKLTFYKAFFSPQWKFLIHTILQCLSAKTESWNEFSSIMAFAIIWLATNQKFNFSRYILLSLVKNIEAGVPFFIFPRVDKLEEENKVLKELMGVHSKVDSDEPIMEKEKSSKQERKIAYIDADVEINLEKAQDEAYNLDLDHQEKVLSMLDFNDEEPYDVEEVLEVFTTAKLITKVVTTAKDNVIAASVEVPKPRKRMGVIIQDPKETTTVTMQPKRSKARKKVKVEISKREGESLEKEVAKKQKMKQETEELKKQLQIIPNDDDDVYKDATPLASKIPIIDYKIHTKRNRPYFKIIRADGNHRMYPLTHFTLEQMINDVRLKVEDESEISLELLRLVKRQLNKGEGLLGIIGLHSYYCLFNLVLLREVTAGKFDGKADEGFFVGYSLNSKAFRVFNNRTRIVEETLHISFSEYTPNNVGSGPNWLFDIDALTKTINYQPIVAGNQSNGNAGTKACDDASKVEWRHDDEKKVNEDPRQESECKDQEKEDNVNNTNNVNVAGTNEVNVVSTNTNNKLPFDQEMPELEDISTFTFSNEDKDDGVEADINNLDTTIQMDVKSAFLYGNIEEKVYVCQPPGFEDPDFPDKVYKVEKTLYGLHQAHRAWKSTDVLVDLFGLIGKEFSAHQG
nr:copia protein [Tanacetum cinerariifolium]